MNIDKNSEGIPLRKIVIMNIREVSKTIFILLLVFTAVAEIAILAESMSNPSPNPLLFSYKICVPIWLSGIIIPIFPTIPVAILVEKRKIQTDDANSLWIVSISLTFSLMFFILLMIFLP
jgi:hypothetical protein